MKKTNEDGIYRLKDGRYRLRVTAVVTGKRRDKQKTLPAGTTMSEAIKKREALKQLLSRRKAPGAQLVNCETVSDYAALWAEKKAKKLRPTTRRTYLYALEHRFLPYLGHVLIRDLNRHHVEDWVAALDEAKKPDGSSYAKLTRRGWWRVGKQILMDLRADFGIQRYLVDRVDPPQKGGGNSRTKETLTAEELAEFVEASKKLELQRHAEIMTLATTAMRVGELYGLTWSAIDYEKEQINIVRAASLGKLRDRTKTDRNRSVPLAPKLSRLLKEQQKSLWRQQHPGLEKNLVFPSTKGTCRMSASLHKTMQGLSSFLELDFNVTPQVLRRSVNTICVSRGQDKIVVRSFMGHSDEEMTELYSGVRMERKRDALVTSLGSLFASDDD